ncbi:hypothetical protein L208DRAFT_1280486 [Tricholoma matsutake]|nr:hypothetical protein L208DRAFT_1280486 [Tricholoma matsutake 945]
MVITGLNWSPIRRDQFLSTIPRMVVEPIAPAYPPLGHWVFESEVIRIKWENHITQGPQPDKQKKRLPMMALDPALLAFDVDASESCIFVTKQGELVAIVLWDFCTSEEALMWLDAVVLETVGVRKSIRLEDPGKLVQVGYSAGSRSSPKFDWVKNLLSARHTPEVVEAMNVKASSACAFVWNLICSRLPTEVIEDFEKFITDAKLVHMDADSLMLKQLEKVYTLSTSGRTHKVELAPATGVFAENYSQAMHHEHQPHKFAVLLTTERSAGAEAGGHFFISKYGIRIRGAQNTLVVCISSEPHGTSLQDFSPQGEEPDFSQRGIAFVTPSRLKSVWEQYKLKLVDQAGAMEGLYGREAGGSEIFE